MEKTVNKYVLTDCKILDISSNGAIQNRTDFYYSYKRYMIETAETVEELVTYCIKNNIEIFSLDVYGNIIKLNNEPFYELTLSRTKRLLMWKGKDLVTAYEFERTN